MKKIFLSVLIMTGSIAAWSQTTTPPDTLWRISGDFGFKFSQVSLTNWAAGGQNSYAFNATYLMNADYAKNKWSWNNLIVLGYGLLKQGEQPLNKTDDQILLNTKLGYDLGKAWYAELNANFRTQFTDGFDLPNDSVRISTFMAPAYLVAGLGFEYKPNDHFNAMINPVSNKTTFVMADDLAAIGAYGVDSASNVRAEFGAYLTLSYKKEVAKNVSLATLFTMFGNYENLAVWDVNWDMILDFKINNWLSANLTTNLIYDQDINIPVDRTGDGIKESFGPRVQFRESFGLGLTAKFNKKTVAK